MIWKTVLFLVGWVLSPFTWWNDVFINIPLSYIIASVLFYITRLPFTRLIIASYWLTNIIGLFFMYLSGKSLSLSSRNRKKTVLTMLFFMTLYTLVMVYLNKIGKLAPLPVFF